MLDVGQLEQYVEEQMRACRVPGLALAIVQGEEVVYARGFGVTSVEDGGVPVTPQTLFRIGSVTKALTGTAIMRLVEAGALELDRPIREYVPWFTLSDRAAAERVTLRMLLSHTSGLPHDYRLHGRSDPAGLEAYVREVVSRYPLVAPPGKVYSYSDPGLDVAGYVAEVVAAKPFAHLMQEMVFAPLEMRRTTFDPLVAMTYPLAQVHDLLDDGTMCVQHRAHDNTSQYPCGLLFSTALDLANFALLHLHAGRFRDRQILSPASVAQMHAIQALDYTPWNGAYGLTFHVGTYKGVRRVGHDGGESSYGARLVLVPDAPDGGLGVVLLCNRAHAFRVASQRILMRVMDEALDLPAQAPAPQPVEPDKTCWPQYVGSYLGPMCGLATVREEAGQLVLDWCGEATPLRALRRDLYLAGGSAVGFVTEPEGPTQFMLLNSHPCRRIEAPTAFVPDADTLASFVGTYRPSFGASGSSRPGQRGPASQRR
ncbi:MAG: beta-lactamase family protein [Chloroflexi bacterium]|nr:beta-lactamase family protein [Chloroflexota bacterium]